MNFDEISPYFTKKPHPSVHHPGGPSGTNGRHIRARSCPKDSKYDNGLHRSGHWQWSLTGSGGERHGVTRHPRGANFAGLPGTPEHVPPPFSRVRPPPRAPRCRAAPKSRARTFDVAPLPGNVTGFPEISENSPEIPRDFNGNSPNFTVFHKNHLLSGTYVYAWPPVHGRTLPVHGALPVHAGGPPRTPAPRAREAGAPAPGKPRPWPARQASRAGRPGSRARG